MEAEIFSVLFIRIKLYYIGNKFDFCKIIIIIIVVLLRKIVCFTRISIDFTNYLLIIHIKQFLTLTPSTFIPLSKTKLNTREIEIHSITYCQDYI